MAESKPENGDDFTFEPLYPFKPIPPRPASDYSAWFIGSPFLRDPLQDTTYYYTIEYDPTSSPIPASNNEYEAIEMGFKRSTILRFPATAILRWMGKNGFDTTAGMKVVSSHLCTGKVTASTVSTAMGHGRSGVRSVPFLDEEDEQKIRDVVANISRPGDYKPGDPYMSPNRDNVVLEKMEKELKELQHDYANEKLKLEETVKDLKEELKETKRTNPRVLILKRPDGTKKRIKQPRHQNYEEMLELVMFRENIMLVGPSGCGKSHLCKQVAGDVKLDFYHINFSAGTSESHLTGRLLPIGKAGQFEYVFADYALAYENGGLYLGDELDAADSNMLLVINTSLSNGYLALPNRPSKPRIDKHPDFVFIGAANTYGRGADRLYVGRNQLDEAFLDRFRVGMIEMDYDEELEAKLCPDDDLRTRLQTYRKRVRENRLERIVSTRFLEKAYRMKTEADWSDDKIDGKLFSGWTEDEIAQVKNESVWNRRSR